MLGNHFNFQYFILAFSIGMLYVYMYKPKTQIVFKFPNPNNVDKIVYNDNNDACYKYNYEEKDCDNIDSSKIKKHPIVEEFRKKKQ